MNFSASGFHTNIKQQKHIFEGQISVIYRNDFSEPADHTYFKQTVKSYKTHVKSNKQLRDLFISIFSQPSAGDDV